MRHLFLFIVTFQIAVLSSFAGETNLKWIGIAVEKVSEFKTHRFLSFEGAQFIDDLPIYHEKTQVNLYDDVSWYLENEVYENLTAEEEKLLKDKSIGEQIDLSQGIGYYRKVPYASVSFVPIRKKPNSSRYEKLVSFDLKHAVVSNSFKKSKTSIQKSFANSSVLASGTWYQLQLNAYGIYKLDYSYLKNILNIDVDNIDPRNIQIFGYGGGMLPERNSEPRVDDLNENAIYVQGEDDGVFNNGDYILFYGEGPDEWIYDMDDQHYHHKNHRYSNHSYYYLTIGSSGKRISNVSSTTSSITHSVNTFSDHLCKDDDANNMIKSGIEWFGEPFDFTTNQSFAFSTPNINNSVQAYLKIHVIARATTTSSFDLSINKTVNQSISIPAVSQTYQQAFYKGKIVETKFTPKASNTIGLDYNKSTTAAIGWLNYIELNVRRNLILYGNQMAFRDEASVGLGNISEFTLRSANSDTKIWDVTDPKNVFEQVGSLAGSNYAFRTGTDSLKEFMAFGSSGFRAPISATKVANQNLHGLSQTDFIIVSHPNFLSQAERLAEFHRNQDNLSVEVITPSQIYHEFSSGAQDIVAIRDFMRMFYERSTGPDDLPKYLLLFGDGSYDNKSRVEENTNYIPTYQSIESKEPTRSYVSDDYYGFLDSNEGVWNSNAKHYVDLGIGRIPCTTLEEAQGIVDKTINYYSSTTMGDWRNRITFIADDEDNNLHANQGNEVADSVVSQHPVFNVDKILLDAYFQVSTSAGTRYPDVQTAIRNNVSKGQLIVNYTGHGGELGWAHERVLQVSDINNWTNKDKLALFITATCEFSRWDDPGRISAGEYVLLNPNGGGVALMTTTRLVYASQNFTLCKFLYAEMFKENNGKMPRIGDIFRLAKFENGSPSDNSRNFTLLGDPAVTLAYPMEDIVTTDIRVNGDSVTLNDTLKALSEIEIRGMVRDKSGAKMSSFNGTVYPTIFDKELSMSTLGNDGGSLKTFKLQQNIVFKGKVSVNNGVFGFKFVVPKDIGYQLGKGKISYYAENGTIDANGHDTNFIIGGTDLTAKADNDPPEIDLFINDENFVFGGTTDENPILLANVSDENGINTIGSGIGHDITAVLDENTENPIILNDFYESDLDSYKSGKISYQLSELKEGKHTLTLKVWDVQNNSSSATTEFIVKNSEEMEISHVLNYPNPFTTSTSFYFEHNQPKNQMEVEIQIFSIAGNLVRTINQYVNTNGYRSDGIAWDGRNDYGEKIGRGVYMYRLKVSGEDGLAADKYERLVIF